MTNGSEESLRFRESFHTRIETLLEQAISQGVDEETVTRAATEAIKQSAEPLLARLREDRPRMLADHAAMWSDVERIINETWGEALDKLYSVIVCAEELGRIWNFANRYDAENDDDRIFDIMSGLLARATRAAFEVHLLLTRGFSAGASARARSVYELAVVARVMAEYGDTHDLPTRYRDHVVIDQYLWAKEHEDKAEELGREPLGRESISELEQQRNLLVEAYGEEFGKNYGWAAPLFPGGRIGISRLEKMVNMDFGRPDYIAHSQEIHPTSWGADLNRELGNHVASWRLTGLAEAATTPWYISHKS